VPHADDVGRDPVASQAVAATAIGADNGGDSVTGDGSARAAPKPSATGGSDAAAYWHPSRSDDPAVRWLVRTLQEAARGLLIRGAGWISAETIARLCPSRGCWTRRQGGR
jgi:hypothetical protein